MTAKTDDLQDGKPFSPGVSGNPSGRKAGSRNRATLIAQALMDGETEALTRKIIEMALAGDTACLKVCIERLIPVRKDSPIRLKLPKVETAADITAATGALICAVGKGEVTPGEAQSVAGLLEYHRKAIEVSEIEGRIRALEEAAKYK